MRWRSFLLGVFLKSVFLGGVVCMLFLAVEMARINRLEKTIIHETGDIVTRGAIDTTKIKWN